VVQHFDVLIIGSGLAGQSAALRLADTHKVGLISKRSLEDSASAWAQGGIAATSTAPRPPATSSKTGGGPSTG